MAKLIINNGCLGNKERCARRQIQMEERMQKVTGVCTGGGRMQYPDESVYSVYRVSGNTKRGTRRDAPVDCKRVKRSETRQRTSGLPIPEDEGKSCA